MDTESRIRNKLQAQFKPSKMELANESHLHSRPGHDTHFRLLIVSEEFCQKSRVQRQREIFAVLAEELQGPVHALTLRALCPDEPLPENFVSPACASSKTRV